MQRKLSGQPTHINQAVPWIYGSVVLGSLLATSVCEAGAGGIICLGLNALLVGAFLAVGRQVGLWGVTDKASVAVSRRHPCPNPPCQEGASS